MGKRKTMQSYCRDLGLFYSSKEPTSNAPRIQWGRTLQRSRLHASGLRHPLFRLPVVDVPDSCAWISPGILRHNVLTLAHVSQYDSRAKAFPNQEVSDAICSLALRRA